MMEKKQKKLKGAHAKKIISKKKEAKKPKEKSSKPKEDYVYQKIDDFADEEKDRIYVYAVVLDCSYAYLKGEKYICVAKLIDDTVHPGAATEYVSASFFARNKDDLPQPSKVGSIIRIHRGQTWEYKKKYQLNCDVEIKGAWTLFDPFEGALPISHSGRTYTWVEKDNQRLKEIRKIAKDFLSKNELETISLKDALKKKPKDFDPLCLVLDVKKKEGDVKFLLCDEEKIVSVKVKPDLFPTVGPQDVVRVRSAYFSEKDSKKLTMESWSNILRVPKEFASAKNLMSALKSKKVSDEVKSALEIYTPQLDKENIITKLLKEKTAKVTPLKDLFAEAAKGKQKLFRIQCNAIEVGPKEPKEWLMVYDTKTKEMQKVDDVLKGKTATLPPGKEYYYKLQLYVKDKSVPEDNNMYILFLCTIDGKGSEFINIGLKKEKPTETHLKELKKIYQVMTRPWNTLDLVVEAVDVSGGQTVYFIVDTELKI
jgi:hypothetical protein